MAILAKRSRKSTRRQQPARPFGQGIIQPEAPVAKPAAFEPSDDDRRFWAAQYDERYNWGTTELNHIEKTAGAIADRLEATRIASRRIEAILADEPADEQLGPEYDAWLDTMAWEARLQDALDGGEFEPRSMPISDADIDAVNAAG